MRNRDFRKRPDKKWLFVLPAIILFSILLSYAVMQLWNSILPEVSSAGKLNFWQALGLLVLCRILFGNFGPGNRFRGRPGFGRSREISEKWQNMNEEERTEFRSKWKEHSRRGGNKAPDDGNR